MKKKLRRVVEVEVEVCERCETQPATCRTHWIAWAISEQPAVEGTHMDLCGRCLRVVNNAFVKSERKPKGASD